MISVIQGEGGGAKGNRTPDLLNAIQALSQLSYGPLGEGAVLAPKHGLGKGLPDDFCGVVRRAVPAAGSHRAELSVTRGIAQRRAGMLAPP